MFAPDFPTLYLTISVRPLLEDLLELFSNSIAHFARLR